MNPTLIPNQLLLVAWSLTLAVTAYLASRQTFGQETQPAVAPRWSAERTVLVTVTVTVQAIDQVKREVTLKGPLGNVGSFVVDERIKRLKEVSVGDEVPRPLLRNPTAAVRAEHIEEAVDTVLQDVRIGH